MPVSNKTVKGNEVPQKSSQELLEEVKKKCNGEHGRYKTREMIADANHKKS
jgi:hypothetical protein